LWCREEREASGGFFYLAIEMGWFDVEVCRGVEVCGDVAVTVTVGVTVAVTTLTLATVTTTVEVLTAVTVRPVTVTEAGQPSSMLHIKEG
jgi:hypothetical protein